MGGKAEPVQWVPLFHIHEDISGLLGSPTRSLSPNTALMPQAGGASLEVTPITGWV